MKTKRRYRPREPEPPVSFQCTICETTFDTLEAFDADPCRATPASEISEVTDELPAEPIIPTPKPIIPSAPPTHRVFAPNALDLTKLRR